MRVLGAGRPQPVADDPLHVVMDVQIVEAIRKAHRARCIAILGNEPRRARIMPVEIIDDDAGLRHHLAARVIPQHRKLAGAPQLQQHRALVGIAEIDRDRRERRRVLIQGDQRLVTIGRQRMQIERQRHGVLPRDRLRSHKPARTGIPLARLYYLHFATGCSLTRPMQKCKWFTAWRETRNRH